MSEGKVLAAVGAGGTVGSLGRWLVALAAGGAVWGTLLINVTGAVALGLLVARLDVGDHHPLLRPFLAVGLLGGWTTYSTFALDAHALGGEGPLPFVTYLAATLVLGSLGALAGLLLGERLWPSPDGTAPTVAREEL